MTAPPPEERSAIVEQHVDVRRDAFTAGRDVVVHVSPEEHPARRRDLPRDVQDFTGRQAELQRLINLATSRESENTVVISAIDGMAGVGKTALVVHAAHRLAARFPDGQLFLDLHGFAQGLEPTEPAEALYALLRALGVIGGQIPPSEEERASLYRTVLAGKRMIIVLDNAATARQVRHLLPGTAGCAVLVTSRRHLAGLEGAHTLPLDVLTHDEAIELFTRIVGGHRLDNQNTAVAEVVELCGLLPLAIRIAAARLASRPRWSASSLAGRLRDQRRCIGELAVGDLSVAAAFAVSYEHLDPDQQRMFRLLGLHPGQNFDIFAAAALADTDLAEAERLLDGLLDVHLLDQLTSNRYRFHDLLRQHAQDIVTTNEPAAACRQDRTRLLDYYLCNAAAAADLLDPDRRHIPPQPARRSGQQPSFDDYTRALEWLEAEQANLVAAVRLTGELGWDHYTWQLPYLLSRYFFLRGYTDDWLDSHQLALAATRRLGDRLAEAITLTNLGVVCRRLGRFHESLRHQQEALARYRQAGDPQGETDTLTNLGIAYRRLGRFRDALQYQQQAVSLQAKSGDRRGQAMTLSNLGMVYERLGQYEAALDHHRRALDLAMEVGDRPREAMILTSIGMVYERLGQYEAALDHHRRALDLAMEVGDQHVEGHTLNNLGFVHARMGQRDVGLEEQQRALALLRQTGSRGDECEALNDIGHTLRLLGRSIDALHLYERALELARRTGDRYQEARAIDGYAAIMHPTDPHTARQHWEQALRIFSELQVPEVDQVNRQLAANQPEL